MFDQVEYKNISIEGPRGVIRTSSVGVKDSGIPEGVSYLGCFKDHPASRVLPILWRDSKMTTEVSDVRVHMGSDVSICYAPVVTSSNVAIRHSEIGEIRGRFGRNAVHEYTGRIHPKRFGVYCYHRVIASFRGYNRTESCHDTRGAGERRRTHLEGRWAGRGEGGDGERKILRDSRYFETLITAVGNDRKCLIVDMRPSILSLMIFFLVATYL